MERLLEKNHESLKKAFIETCYSRAFEVNKEKAMKILESVSSNTMQKKFWKTYLSKTSYANEISFEEIMTSIGRLIEIMM